MTPDGSPIQTHRRRRLTGRDPDEAHRSATPLELLYDLTFVVAFGAAANELAHYVAEDHISAGIFGFVFAALAVSWAWINYSWFASAYDTDDWVFRLATMVQMVGVIVLALGLQEAFASIDHGDTLDNGVMVAGYVVMRSSMLVLWWLAQRHDPEHAPAAMTYIVTIGVAQVGWVVLVFLSLPITTTFALATVLFAIEFTGPVLAERRKTGTPWHAHHIAERYGLLVIITLGEGVIGTVAALNAVVHGEEGWTVNAVLVAVAGVGLTFGCWWTYFAVPWGDMVAARRGRAFTWAYGHIGIFGSLAAIGAGVHVAAYYLEHKTELGPTAVLLSTAIPVAIYLGLFYLLYTVMVRETDPFHYALLAGTAGVLALSVILAASGVSVPVCLVVLMFAPVVTVIGYETLGHRHMEAALERMRN